MQLNFSALLALLILAIFPSSFIQGQENHPPTVKIVYPKPVPYLNTGKTIPYEIEVQDEEDGFTIYDEIEASSVFMELSILSDEKEILTTSKRAEPRGLRLIKDHACMTCHYYRKKYVGPSYLEISGKHQGKTDFLLESIREGSQGQWGDIAVMPAHPHLDHSEINAMAEWIASLYQTSVYTDILVGTSGIIQIDPVHAGKYLFVKASYRDRGTDNSNRLLGEASLRFNLQ